MGTLLSGYDALSTSPLIEVLSQVFVLGWIVVLLHYSDDVAEEYKTIGRTASLGVLESISFLKYLI